MWSIHMTHIKNIWLGHNIDYDHVFKVAPHDNDMWWCTICVVSNNRSKPYGIQLIIDMHHMVQGYMEWCRITQTVPNKTPCSVYKEGLSAPKIQVLWDSPLSLLVSHWLLPPAKLKYIQITKVGLSCLKQPLLCNCCTNKCDIHIYLVLFCQVMSPAYCLVHLW